MKTFIVSLHVLPERVDDFVKLTLENAAGSVQEEGNVRFDVLRDADDPCLFRLLEVWRDDDAIAHHRGTEHYTKWAAEVNAMLSQPRSKSVSEPVYFTEK